MRVSVISNRLPTIRPGHAWQDGSRQGLGSNIFHQSTRYEASPYAVPFLIELAAEPTTPGRPSILGLLAGLALGDDEYWLPDGDARYAYLE